MNVAAQIGLDMHIYIIQIHIKRYRYALCCATIGAASATADADDNDIIVLCVCVFFFLVWLDYSLLNSLSTWMMLARTLFHCFSLLSFEFLTMSPSFVFIFFLNFFFFSALFLW